MRERLLYLAAIGLCLSVVACGSSRPGSPAVEVLGADEAYEFAAGGSAVTGYRLTTGDVFDVNFLFEPQLSSRVTVRPDGAVALPIMGEVLVAGRTPGELDSLLTRAYATYFKDPELTVNVTSFAPPSVYLLGEVRYPQQIELKAGLSMLQAVATAGGVNVGANLGSVLLIRRTGERQGTAERVDLARRASREEGGPGRPAGSLRHCLRTRHLHHPGRADRGPNPREGRPGAGPLPARLGGVPHQ